MDYSLPGSSVHGISQARILEWVAISFSMGSSWPRDQTRVSFIGRRVFFTTEPPEKSSLDIQFSSVAQSCLTLCNSGLQHTRCPCPSLTPRACSNSCPLTQWYYPTISSSIVPFSGLQSFPASGSFQTSQIFTSSSQSIVVSASTSVLPMNIQDWFPLGWTGWISLQSKGLSRLFSNTTIQKRQFFGTQLSL